MKDLNKLNNMMNEQELENVAAARSPRTRPLRQH